MLISWMLIQAQTSQKEWFDLIDDLIKQEKYEEVIEVANKGLESYPRSLYIHTIKGKALSGLKRWQETHRNFDFVLSIDSTDVNTLYNKAVALQASGNGVEALKYYEKLLVIEPDDAVSLNNMGIIAEGRGEYEKALELYDRAIAYDPINFLYWYNKGVVYGEMEMCEEAIKCYARAFELNPMYKDALRNREIEKQKLRGKSL